jgi:glucose/galactose transporter
MAIPSSWILKKTGFAKGMSVGLIVMALGALIFIPAAYERSYVLFLCGLFVMGTGLSLLQTAANPYITILGPIESAAKRMSIMGLFNKIAGMIGILVLGSILFSEMETLNNEILHLTGNAREIELNLLVQRLLMPYIIMAISLFAVSFMILLARLPEVTQQTDTNSADDFNAQKSIFNFPYLWLGIMALFLYVGVEVIAIDTLGLYGETQGISKELAPKLGTFSLIALTIGYLVGIYLVPKHISQAQALSYSAVIGFVFAVIAICTSGITSVVFIILLSFAHSVMWPAIWPLAINDLGKHTPLASAFLIMAIAGGAVLPLLYGSWATSIDNRHLPYLILLPCYIFIFYYATYGYKAGRR